MIRKATLNDVDFIHTMSKENLDSTFTKETLKSYIETDQTYHVFCIEKTELIGYIIVWESATYGQIIDLVIQPNYQNKGYGQKLLTYAIDYFIKIGVNIISLEVKVSNAHAIKLYEKAGFKKDHVIKNYYQTEDGYFYVRRLDV